MKKIVWQTEYQSLLDSFRNRVIAADSRGAYVYEYLAAHALAERYHVTMDPMAVRGQRENSLAYYCRLHRQSLPGEAFVKSPSVIVHGKRHPAAIDLGILHHIYFASKKQSLKGKLSLQILHRRLRELDVVVTVSRYWQEYLEGIGCRKVKVIHNGFDLHEYTLTDNQIADFRQRYNLPFQRPLIYIGYTRGDKGVFDVYEALKDTDYTLVMTGQPASRPAIPIRHLLLNRHDYLCLLSACDIVLSMSQIEEGWSRISHEALLCGTPVIGSGSGGMQELLDGASQPTCKNIRDLPAVVSEVLVNRHEIAVRGSTFARQFDLPSFNSQWQDLFKELLGG